MSKEMVNHPEHYNSGSVECIDAMVSSFGVAAVRDFCELNAFKYLFRSKHKGTHDEDIRKAIWYLNKSNDLAGGCDGA